jgi:hypothetical protein
MDESICIAISENKDDNMNMKWEWEVGDVGEPAGLFVFAVLSASVCGARKRSMIIHSVRDFIEWDQKKSSSIASKSVPCHSPSRLIHRAAA